MFEPILSSDSLKRAYEKSLRADKIQLTRVSSTSVTMVLLASVFMDMWALPSVLYEVILLRVFVIIGLVILYVITYYPTFFIKNYAYLISTSFLVSAFSVEYSIYLSSSSELAYYTYFAAIIVGFMILYSWTYLSIKNLLLITVIIIGGYVFAIALRDDQGPHGAFPLILVTVSTFLGATFMGVIGKLIRDKHLHEKFLLQQSFKKLFEEKLEESEVHKYDANHDTLTGLPNRRYIDNHLNIHLDQIKQLNMIMVVMFLDLNDFKKINDFYGHEAGDEVLKVTATRLKFCLCKKDMLVRLGGDEFLVCIAIENDDTEVISSIVNRIRATISQPIIFEGIKLEVATSIGVATSMKDGNEIDTLIAVADKKMYQDKHYSNKEKFTSVDNVTIISPRV